MSGLAILGGACVRTAPFASWPQYSEQDEQRLLEVLRSRNWGGYPFPNRYATEFGERFASQHGAAHGCCVANGTVAITIALRAAGLRFGDEVIVPAYTWDGTATAVLDAGCVPVFADVDPDSYCLSAEAARKAITPKTRAIVPVHLAMRFADMDALGRSLASRGLILIEDCAHAHGGAWNGEGAGSMGDAGTFSFQTSKTMTAGEGGAVITSRLDLFELVESIVNCGRASATDQYGKRVAGGNYRITEFQAALLTGQLEMLPDLTERRARNAGLLSEALAGIEGVAALPPQKKTTREFHYNYVFPVSPERQRRQPGYVRGGAGRRRSSGGRPLLRPVYRSDLFRVTRTVPATADGPREARRLQRGQLPGVRARGLRRGRLDSPIRAPRHGAGR